MTNSKHVAAVLSKAQCTRDHDHIHLEDGRTKAAEQYPAEFCDAICRGTRMELDDAIWLNKVHNKISEANFVGTL